MDSPISSTSLSSINTTSTPLQVFSPVPRRTPILHKKSNFDEIPFFDLGEDSDNSRLSRANSYLMDKLRKMTMEDIDFENERRISLKFMNEVERKTIMETTDQGENFREDMRPPSRAINPQCNDEEFVRMNQQSNQFVEIDGKNILGKKTRLIDWL
jgi:hypothetical protein